MTGLYVAFKEPTFAPIPTVPPLPKYYPGYQKATYNPVIPYRTITTPTVPIVPYNHYFPKYTTTTTTTNTTTTTTTTTTYTTTTYTTTTTTTTTTYTTTTTTTWYKPIKLYRPKIHENIGPAPMPTPLGPYNPYYKQKPFTSTTFKYEDYVE